MFDLGGSTTDISILAVDGTHFEVKASVGDCLLGGDDWYVVLGCCSPCYSLGSCSPCYCRAQRCLLLVYHVILPLCVCVCSAALFCQSGAAAKHCSSAVHSSAMQCHSIAVLQCYRAVSQYCCAAMLLCGVTVYHGTVVLYIVTVLLCYSGTLQCYSCIMFCQYTMLLGKFTVFLWWCSDALRCYHEFAAWPYR